MNNFTKEELKELMNGVWCTHRVHKIPINQKLFNKLKSMCVNYCEHEKKYYDIVIFEKDNITTDATVRINCKCLKCDKALLI